MIAKVIEELNAYALFLQQRGDRHVLIRKTRLACFFKEVLRLGLAPAAAEVKAAGEVDPKATAGIDGDRANLGRGGGAGTRDVKPAILAQLLA